MITTKSLTAIIISIMLTTSLVGKPKREVLRKGDLMMMASPNGYVNLYVHGKYLFSSHLQVHWIRSQHKSKDQVMRRNGNTVSYNGTLNNISFVSNATLDSDGAKLVYELNLKQKNDFAVTRNWEITPYLSMKTLKTMTNCTYSYESAQGEQTGKISDIISTNGNIKSFTIYNYQGYDITLCFPTGAKLADRRKEKKPQGIWFFCSAVNEEGKKPKLAGERGRIEFNIKVRKTNSAKTAQKLKSIREKKNLNVLVNGGFEVETNPGYADGWGPFYWGWPGRGETSPLMDLKSFVAIDKTQAYEGKQSLRIILPDKMKELNVQHPYIRSIPNNQNAVFSIYMKSFRDKGAKVCLGIRPISGGKFTQKTFIITKNWKRYVLKFKTPKRGLCQTWIRVRDGIVWLDAAKVEAGTEATAFVSQKQNKKSTVAVSKTNKKIYNIPVLTHAPPMDGDLNNSFWEKALTFDKFYRTHSKKMVKTNKTIAKVAISGNTLYIGFECFGKNRLPVQKKRDSMVWTDDSVEIFIDPGSMPVMDATYSQGSYYHFAVNSLGTVYDSYTGGVTRGYDGPVKTFCKRFEDKWIAQIAINISSLDINKLKQDWRINLCREDHTNKQYSSAFDLKHNFHSYADFGHAKIPKKLYKKLTNFNIRSLQIKPNGKISFELNSKKSTFNSSATLQIIKANKIIYSGKWNGNIKSGNNICSFPAKKIKGKNLIAKVTLNSADGSSFYKKFNIVNNKRAIFRKDYYTTEKNAELIWQNLPALAQSGKLEFGDHSASYKTVKNKIMVDISKIPTGKYQLKINSQNVSFKKLPPKANAVKIDKTQNILLVDNKPYIFYGPFLNINHKSKFLAETYSIRAIKKAGFNGVSIKIHDGLNMSNTWAQKNRLWNLDWFVDIMDACHKNGLRVIIGVTKQHHMGKDFKYINPLEKIAPKIKDHPALLAWYIADEPTLSEREETWRRYHYLRKQDPYHPVIVDVTSMGLANNVVADPKTGKQPFEIFSLTYYPIGCTMHPDTEIGLKTGHLLFKQMFNAVKKINGVMIHAAQSYGYGTDSWLREPTPAEVSFLIYMPLIYGNRGWKWFGGRPKCQATWNAIISYGKEVKKLTPVLTNSQKVNDDKIIFSSCGNAYGILRKLGNAYYFITVNKTAKTIQADFNLLELLPADFKKAEVVFENRQIKIGGTEKYTPYQRHVYRIKQ
jgi:hypothetical protein